jgi:hypothetical protein
MTLSEEMLPRPTGTSFDLGHIITLSCSPSGHIIAAVFMNRSHDIDSYFLVLWTRDSCNNIWEWSGGAQLKFDTMTTIGGICLNWFFSQSTEYLGILSLSKQPRSSNNKLIISIISVEKLLTGRIAEELVRATGFVSIMNHNEESRIRGCRVVMDNGAPLLLTWIDNKVYLIKIEVETETVRYSLLWTDVSDCCVCTRSYLLLLVICTNKI